MPELPTAGVVGGSGLKLDPNSTWNDLYASGISPWDLGEPNRALVKLLQAQPAKLPPAEGKRALVPGCGKGYDVLYLASLGYEATGIDIAALAIDDAKGRVQGAPEPVQRRTHFVADDFFTPTDQPRWSIDGGYDLIFEYTFLCALQPAFRTAWATRLRQLIKAEGGRLVTLMFPIATHEGGPPFALSKELYEELLGAVGFELVESYEVPEEDTQLERRKGKEIMGIWRVRE